MSPSRARSAARTWFIVGAVTRTAPFLTATDGFAALLRGTAIPFAAFRMSPEEFLCACTDHDVTSLVDQRLRELEDDWPDDVREAIAERGRARAAMELVRRRELNAVLDGLAAEGIRPIVLKGTALAYSLYDHPASRPRFDTDVLIRRNQVDAVRLVMARSGYSSPAYCDGELLFGQFPSTKTDQFGVAHTFDFHWKISTQAIFADVLSFDEISADAIRLPSIGAGAWAACPVHALLLACVHPVMHHRNVESLIWIYDIHLIASRLSEHDLDRFADLAVARHVSAICAHQLAAARHRFGTAVSDRVIARLGAVTPPEPSAAYLRTGRRWRDELVSNVRALPRWGDRVRLLREVMLPGPAYMLKAYDLRSSSLSAALLPALYVHRLALGSWKVLAGRK